MRRPRVGDAVAVAGILAVVAVYLAPALRDGATFAPFDIANQLSSMTIGLSGTVHNHLDGDLVTQMLPWSTLDWQLVHAGQFPLWNGYEVLGMPQFLNFESAVLSLPDLVGYLVPLRDAFIVAVAVKLTIAGTGSYLAARVLGMRPSAAWFAGATYMLCGPFSAWLGWSMADVFAYAGFLGAFSLLAYRRRARTRYVVLLAVTVAFSVYGGFPEANVLLGALFAVVLAVALAAHVAGRRRLALDGLGRVAAGVAAGLALAAPLWLPGAQVLSGAARAAETPLPALGLHVLVLDLFPGWYGLPTSASGGFGPVNYYESVGYVGIAALVLAVTAVVTYWRRPLVLGLAAGVAAGVVAVYGLAGAGPVQALAHAAGAGSLGIDRARAVVAFLVAMLAGLGVEAALAGLSAPALPPAAPGAARARRVGDVFLAAALAMAALVAGLAFAGAASGLAPAEQHARDASLLGPCLAAGATLVVAAAVWWGGRTAGGQQRYLLAGGALVLLGGQTAFLVTAGAGLSSYSHTLFPTTAATAAYTADVGDALVGIDGGNVTSVRGWAGVGFYPDVNVGYRVRQFAAHDPALPAAYFDWPGTAPSPASTVNLFAPSITSAAEARAYGIGFILAADRLPAPAGTTFVAAFAGARLYRVPGAAVLAFAGAPAGATVQSVAHPTDRSWSARVTTPAPATLVLHLTALSGWHVAADGRPLAVHADGTLMEEVTVPAGRRTLTVWYWPADLTLGIRLALAAAVALAAWCVAPRAARLVRGRRRGREGALPT